MYRNKKDIDKHVETLTSKLSLKEFKTRAYSVARLYFEVGDFVSCVKYVELYLSSKDKNPAAHKLLGQAFQKLGQKEKAFEQYKTSLEIDPTQTNTILDICELLTDDEVTIDPGRVKYWCEKAETIFPRHPVTFRLREKLLKSANSDPEALVKLLNAELEARPKDVVLHVRLLKHYLSTNQIKEAFEHSCNIEFDRKLFSQNIDWYDVVSLVLKHNTHNCKDWLYQLLLLTVKEKLCLLSLAEIPSGTSKSLFESNDLLFAYDQAIENIVRTGAPLGFAEFHSCLLQHHKGQLAFHTATFLLKKAKKDRICWRESVKLADPLMLIAWHVAPIDTRANWLRHFPEKQKEAVQRWCIEGSYRCSQSGHYLLSNYQGKNQMFIDHLSQYCLGSEWKDKLFEKIYSNYEHQEITKTYIASNSFNVPVLRLPRRSEVQVYDEDAQREYPNSLHHLVWIILNYKNYSDFKCTLFNMLLPTITNCGPEGLNKLDIQAFMYCAALTAAKQKRNFQSYAVTDKPLIIPANITDLLCTLTQIKWWDCAYKFCQNDFGSELTDIRATVSSGIEAVRCIDTHGLDPELLCLLGRIFSEQAKNTTVEDESSKLEKRAFLYYSAAIPLLTRIKNKSFVKIPEKRIFDYTHTDLSSKELNSLIEESKLYVALISLQDSEYEKVVELLSDIKSPKAYYYLAQTYKRVALDEKSSSKDSASDSKRYSLLNKSKHFAHKALEKIKESEAYRESSLCSETQELIEEVETYINKLDLDFSCADNNTEGKHSSDENVSLIGTEQFPLRSSYHFRNISSTPKHQSQANVTYYRTAIDSQLIENNRLDHQYLERIEKQIKNLQKKDAIVNEFIEQTRTWLKENDKKRNEIINTINSNTEMITGQFKSLNISLDQIKGQIHENKNESKDVVDLKKQIAELKKEVLKLKKGSSDQTIDESDYYNLDENYRTSDSSSTFTPHMAFTPSQVMPPFTQRLVPSFPIASNPYQLYGPNLYSLYSQYSQFAQPQTIPGAPIFDPTRGQMNYPNVYQTPDQMYLDVAHLIPPSMSATSAPPVSTVPVIVPTISVTSTMTMGTSASSASLPTTAAVLKGAPVTDVKELSRSLPVNVVITSSDPLPTCTTMPVPILSVTIPPQHIKASPHNYQIPMPSTNESKVITLPKFSFIQAGNTQTTTTNASSIWNSTIFTGSQPASLFNNSMNLDKNVSVVVSESSPNTTINKSRTLSEKSNTSVENYDPCPDFKPIIPLPAEVKVTTGEEDEVIIFTARAKLFRFVDKQWKERGLGEMKLLQHKKSGKVRVLMRREQIHKVCANHIILPEMEIKPMKNETKAYFWVANDFAEETVILEKFCIRFKTAEVAKQFYETFEKARQEASISSSENVNQKQDEKIDIKETKIPANDQNKTFIGGFSFTNIPLFKTINDTKKSDNSITPEPAKSKVNVFSNLSFKTNSETKFSTLFNVTTKQAEAVPLSEQQSEKNNTNSLNTSDVVEEYEPTVDFKPVVPLPALIDQKTGEEDEIILFEHRAKLLRYDASTKEWKERGLGNMKLLMHKDNNDKIRLLMRREQIMKVCCNHAINREMIFQKMPNMDKAVTWCAKDFADGELIAETFCLRFKTVQICDEFVEAVKAAQSKIKNNVNEIKYEQRDSIADKSNNKIGPCSCKNCFANSSGSNFKLPCCQVTEPQIEPSSNWGDKFKTKPGSWECKVCYIRNESNAEICCACNNSKSPNLSTADSKSNTKKENSFNFVMPVKSSSAANSWGDKFKPKEGTWECNQCLVRNEGDVSQCSACNSPKDPTTITKESKSVPVNNAPKFTFGIPQNVTKEQNLKSEPQSMINTTNSQKFTFGIPATKSNTVISFGEQKNSSYFDASKSIQNKEVPLNYSIKNNTGIPAAHQTNIFHPSQPNVSKSFFTFNSTQNEWQTKENFENNAAGLDQAQLPSSPFSTLKEIVGDVISEEDNESLIFGQKANLYKFISNKWEKKAVGILKILKHNENNKLRIVMRQDEDSTICLNYYLTSETKYKYKDDKSWHISVNDCSEKEPRLEHFCLKFPNAEYALQFKKAVDSAYNSQNAKVDLENDEVVFVGEILASLEEKQKAIELKLPENFYTYKNKPPCQGCRGCNDDDVDEAVNRAVSLDKSKSTTESSETQFSTPVKSQNVQSPTNSLYGTPGNFNETVDVSIFRTPSGSNTSLLVTNTNNIATDTFNKENKTEKPDVFTDFTRQKLTLGTSNAQSNIFNIQPSSITKKSILAPPKFDALNSSQMMEAKKKTDENKSKFGGAAGTSSNKSIFQLPNIKDSTQGSEIKSIFGGDQKPVNLFSENTHGSMFGPSALKVEEKKGGDFSSFPIQGVSVNSTIFGTLPKETVASSSKANTNNYQTDTITKPISKQNAELKENKENELTNLAPVLKIDNALSFAALSTSGSGFNVQKKTDFKWEGAGQQLFTGRSNNNNDQTQDISANDENESKGNVDGEYDPHYEPIIPLPDKIVVTTGEEDEEKLFGDRCKLFRYDDKSREWKERGIGEIKILFHPKRVTYRLLLRRELVHKAVLNMLLFPDLELLPMKNSDRAWTWAGINYAENVAGEQETLAVRFKSINLATNFRDKVVECVRKLQAAAADEIRKAKEISENQSGSVAPLRLPKHLESSSRVNLAIKNVEETVEENEPKEENDSVDHSEINDETVAEIKQVHFEETEEDDITEDDEYDDNLYQDEEYNEEEEEEEEAGVYFSCEGEAIVQQGSEKSTCPHAHIQVVFDQDIYSPKIIVTDSNTGEVLADTLIYTNTEFQITDDSCTWSGTDYDSVNKTVTINFPDSKTAIYFYDSCETSKTALCSSMDPDS